jgi:spermidine/putrescine transport system ATP-binding protein
MDDVTAVAVEDGLDSPARAEPDIRLRGVTKRFGSVVAVDDLDLEIGRGAFFALLGPSGCGKTTTLRMIGGFEEPTAGTIALGGRDVTADPPYRRDVNTVFQSYALFPHLDVARNVAFGLERRKVDRRETRKRVAEVLELTQLTGFERRRPGQLSGGQQQRVALARALVNRPRALLLDEPLGALDLRLRRQLQLELKRIQQDVGITFVHVTHDQEEAMTMADEIAVMHEGRIEQRGSAADLYERPRTAFVAGFLGVSNLLDADLQGTDGAWATVRPAQDVVLRVPADRCRHVTGAVRCGVRPEKVTIAPAEGAAPEPGANVLHGVVTVASFLGAALQYVVTLPDGLALTVIAQNVDGRPPESLGPGREVALSWDAHHTFVVEQEPPT